MPLDVLILNSGEWALASELPADPWHILVYRQVGERRNELHIWLPRQGMRGSGEYAFRRYWVEGRTRWCVEVPRDPDRPSAGGARRLRFTSPDGLVLWVETGGSKSLGDFTDRELQWLREKAKMGAYTHI